MCTAGSNEEKCGVAALDRNGKKRCKQTKRGWKTEAAAAGGAR